MIKRNVKLLLKHYVLTIKTYLGELYMAQTYFKLNSKKIKNY
jgi:hypothetical protein